MLKYYFKSVSLYASKLLLQLDKQGICQRNELIVACMVLQRRSCYNIFEIILNTNNIFETNIFENYFHFKQ